jgi:D-alanyl-lipoteichoic acid acyltransferase DltB (MBOAT superfamily)
MKPHIFQNLEFFVLLGPALLTVVLLKRVGPQSFRMAIIAFSAFFILAMPNIKMAYVVLVLAVLASIFIVSRVLLRLRSAGAKVRLLYVVLGCVIVFSLVKFGSVSSFISKSLGLAGDYRVSILPVFGFAFLALKSYSLLADICGGKIKQIGFMDFTAYFLFFPTFLAGPLERFGKFALSLNQATSSRDELRSLQTELPRFLIGAFKVFVVAGVFQRYALPFLKEDDFASGRTLYLGAVAYYAFEYMNFSGYSDMAISAARVLGIKLPENFNFPYMARSLTELWRRWHMSFAAWLRDYIYYPLLFLLMQRLRPASAAIQIYLSALSIFITFVICGLWHGDQTGTVLFGVLSGLVLGAEAIVTARYDRRVARALEEKPKLRAFYDAGARIFTFHVAALTFAPVLLSNQQLGYVWRYFSAASSGFFYKYMSYLELFSIVAKKLWDKL